MREELIANALILKRLAEIEKDLLLHDSALRDIYEQLQPLLAPPRELPKPEIGHIKEDSIPYRLKRKKPDIVLPKYKTVIFIYGCFRHRHPCPNKDASIDATSAKS